MSSLSKRGRYWYLDIRRNGKRHRISLGVSDYRGAQSIARDLEDKFAREALGLRRSERITIRTMIDRFLEYSSSQHSKRTTREYRSAMYNHLVDWLDEYPGSITQQDVDKLRSGLSRANANKVVRYVRALFNWGKARGYEVPDLRWPITKLPELRNRYLEEGEIDKIIECSGELKPLIMTAIHTGMRASELFNLKWENVDLDEMVLVVSNSQEWHTKSYRNRTIPMSKILRDVLNSLPRGSEYVFPARNGGPRTTVRKALNTIARKAGVDKFTLHDLRRTFSSHAAFNSPDLAGVQKLLGHASIVTTMGYIKHDVSRLRRIVNSAWNKNV